MVAAAFVFGMFSVAGAVFSVIAGDQRRIDRIVDGEWIIWWEIGWGGIRHKRISFQ